MSEPWLIQRYKNATKESVQLQVELNGYCVWLEPGEIFEIRYEPPKDRKDTSYFQQNECGLIEFWCAGGIFNILIDGEKIY